MPDHLVPASKSYYIHSATLKSGLQSVMRGGGLCELQAPLWFPACPLLQQLFGWIYCRIYHLDPRAAAVLGRNAGLILKQILKASPEKMAAATELDAGNECDGWGKESAAKIRAGHIFSIDEGLHVDWYGERFADRTVFKMDCSDGRVSFAQIENRYSPGEERNRCVLDISVQELQTRCLSAYIRAEHEAGRIADLSDLDLNLINTDGIDFSCTRFRAAYLPALVRKRTEISLLGAQLTGSCDPEGLYFIHFRIDRALALQLIAAGADTRAVLIQYLQSGNAARNRNIDLDGFDLRGLDLKDVDLRNVNFQFAHGTLRRAGPMPAGRRCSGPVYDARILEAQLDDEVRWLISDEATDNCLLQYPTRVLARPNARADFTLQHFRDFARRLDALHARQVVLRDLRPEKIRLFNDRIYFIDQNTSGTPGTFDPEVCVTGNPHVPPHFRPGALRSDLYNAGRDEPVNAYRLDQYCLCIVLMQIAGLNPDPSSIYFAARVAQFVAGLPCGEARARELEKFLLDPVQAALSGPLHSWLCKS